MSLTLRFQTTGRVPGNARPVEMRGQNLTVGRSPDNDLVLPDPDRTISKRHCVLEQRADRFVVIDISSNGTFLNYAKDPLGPELHPVHDGDILSVGPYELIVSLSGAAPDPGPPDPPAEARSAPVQDTPAPMPSDGAGDLLDDLLGPPEAGQGDGGALIPDDADDDLLGGLPGLSPEPAHTSPPRYTHEPQGGVSGQSFAPSAPSGGLIPDDWDLEIGGGDGTADDAAPAGGPFGGGQSAAPGGGAGAPPPERPADPPPTARGDDATRPMGPAETPPPQADPAPGPADAAAPHAPQPSPPDRPGAPADADIRAARAFLEALGASDLRIPDEDLEDAMTRLGATMRALIVGVREVLMTRSAIKGEFRMGQTVIRSSGNNPLKFSISEDEAVERMARPPGKGYVAPEAAVEEAMRDIRAHEVAMVSGMQAALGGLLAQFDPDTLAAKLADSGRSGGFLKSRKSQYWEIFEETYASISDQAENEFHELFTREFAQAYQSQLEKLK